MPTVPNRVVAHATQRRRKAAMAGRPDPVSVRTEFLQKGLDKGPVLVSELEAAARAAGLLGSDQSISEAKLFKRAKKSLGVRSVHSGFGSAGKWFWLLETPAPLVADPPARPLAQFPVQSSGAERGRQNLSPSGLRRSVRPLPAEKPPVEGQCLFPVGGELLVPANAARAIKSRVERWAGSLPFQQREPRALWVSKD